MYSPRRSYGSPPPELSNNPFIDHPNNALARYPDISKGDISSANSQQHTPWMQPTGSSLSANPGAGYGAGVSPAIGMSPTNSSFYPSPPPQQPTWNGSQGYPSTVGGSGFAPPIQSQPTGLPFQPTSSFGQQLAGQMNEAYGRPPQQQQQQQPQQQYTGYPTNPQYGQPDTGYGALPQQQRNPQYLAEFDPYGSTSATPSLGQPQGGAGSQYNTPHPRDYIQQHKMEMEQWDQYSWKQALNCFDSLKEAWAARKREIETRARALGGVGLFGGGGYGGAYSQQAQQMAQLEQMAKEAESNFGSVAASTFQMQEVFTGYRQSGDLASKRRVRESINAALASLPDWPPRLY
ncbi:unnamed protein product [Somion occarium]|uniref:Uncharacterized protein n=1 Tax=Somion occarium TaxID=3059160 RepID=A0ABP1E9Q7_9APHY